MNKQEKIDAIYKEIANKELIKGCVINDTDYFTGRAEIFGEYNHRNLIVIRELDKEKPYIERKTDIEDWEIIGQDIMIGDVLDWWKSKEYKSEGVLIEITESFDLNRVFSYWGDYRKPIEEQSEECIDFIHKKIK